MLGRRYLDDLCVDDDFRCLLEDESGFEEELPTDPIDSFRLFSFFLDCSTEPTEAFRFDCLLLASSTDPTES
jgi:hypothetical protein